LIQTTARARNARPAIARIKSMMREDDDGADSQPSSYLGDEGRAKSV